MSVEYLIRQYGLQQGALEIQYIEEFFLDFPRKKTVGEVMRRLSDRDHQILMAEAPLPDDPSTVVPVSFKVAHELKPAEHDPKLADLVLQLEDVVDFNGRRILYQWIGGTRKDWRGQGHFRALTEEQEVWAMDNGFDEIVVKTKNRFYEMRSTLAQLQFDVIRFVPHPLRLRRVEGLPQQAARPARHRQSSLPPFAAPRRRLIHEIDRDGDPRLEPYRNVGDAGWLRARGLFVVEGRLGAARLLALGAAVESLLVTPAAFAAFDPALLARCTVYVAPQAIVNGVTGFDFHRGCLALAPRPPLRAPDEFSLARRLVVLEGVNNPDNVGGIFRSAAALGADAVLLGPGTGDPLYRKAVRTSMGAALWLPFAELDPWPGALRRIRAMGFEMAALSPSGTLTLDEFVEQTPPDARLALLVGAEGTGLTQAALAGSDTTVRIPVAARSDSLNVTVAASIALDRLRTVSERGQIRVGSWFDPKVQ